MMSNQDHLISYAVDNSSDTAFNDNEQVIVNVPVTPVTRQLTHQFTQPIKIGELIVLGHNGALSRGEKGRRRSKFLVYRRSQPNGVRKAKCYAVNTPQSSQAVLDTQQYSASYTLSDNSAIVVEYVADKDSDMFQIGRSSEEPIDFVVIDNDVASDDDEDQILSTVSRFACRIVCNRNNIKDVKIFAAGFDSCRNIFLGKKAIKWKHYRNIDGLTTNGVLIMQPVRSLFCKDEMGICSPSSDKIPGWREVSVCGELYVPRETRSKSQRGVLYIGNESNCLIDGTLIDLCGVTMLWRSDEGLEISPSRHYLELFVDKLNVGRPSSLGDLNTLVSPRKQSLLLITDKQAYVYLNCGHVRGFCDWTMTANSHLEMCPVCWAVGPIVKLCMGMERAFHTDWESPTHCFNPCGHMASEATVRYWSFVSVPLGPRGFRSICPFCATPLGAIGFTRLIFQDRLDEFRTLT